MAPLKCHCDNTPTCVGRYEGHGDPEVGCDTCCGHGNEDGVCYQLNGELKEAIGCQADFECAECPEPANCFAELHRNTMNLPGYASDVEML